MGVWRNVKRGYRNRAKSGEGIMKAESYRLTYDENFMFTYCYEIGDECVFSTNSMNEVGEPYQEWFREALRKCGWQVETREIETAPWVADFLKGTKHA